MSPKEKRKYLRARGWQSTCEVFSHGGPARWYDPKQGGLASAPVTVHEAYRRETARSEKP